MRLILVSLVIKIYIWPITCKALWGCSEETNEKFLLSGSSQAFGELGKYKKCNEDVKAYVYGGLILEMFGKAS